MIKIHRLCKRDEDEVSSLQFYLSKTDSSSPHNKENKNKLTCSLVFRNAIPNSGTELSKMRSWLDLLQNGLVEFYTAYMDFFLII